MKKFLGILGTITIAGNGISGIVGNKPAKIKENNNLQTSNSKVLSRSKRHKTHDNSCAMGVTVGAGVGGGGAIGAGTGAAAGAAIGSVVPGLGTAVGALVGGTVGFFTGAGVGGGVGFSAAPNTCAKNINEYILNTDLKIINSDDNITILNEVKKLNQSLNINNLYVTEKTNTSAKIVASSSSNYKTESAVVVNFINQRHLSWTPDLLKNWGNNYHKWNEEVERQKIQDVPHFCTEQKRTWKDDKNFQIRTQFHSLLQNIVIIQNHFYIKELYNRIITLENDLSNLKIEVERLSSGTTLSLCASSTGLISSSSSIVPVIGNIVSYISGLISASCYLANEFA
ncbi:hypothetical protein [Spiroplasma endosymbiont of Dilophus febrilis]|uniref:hypothetical protein n=1 Tax=Spiroplasma endosymbiont of Dilophus febrilis TaxID=3066292 RepID=UPI00313F18F7